jgi:aspartyl protease family protein
MMKPLLIVVAIGVGIGAMMPSRGKVAPVAETGRAARSDGTVSPTEPLRELVLDRRRDGHFYVDGLVNGAETRFLIDTGATHVALTVEDARSIGIKVTPEDFEYVGEGAGGALRGQPVMLDRVSIGGRVVTNAHASVIEGLGVSLLGQSVLTQLGTLEMNDRRLIIR